MKKSKMVRAYGVPLAAGALVLASGCVVQPNGQVTFGMPVVAVQPAVVEAPPPPPVVVEEPVLVPETYVWDGVEFVGVVNGQFMYLGPGEVWVVCEPFRLERFHGWERYHADWREHAIHNERYRRDFHGRELPRRGEPGHPQPGHPQPGHGEPGHPQPGHGEPGHAAVGQPQPGHSQAAPAQPAPGKPAPKKVEPKKGDDKDAH